MVRVPYFEEQVTVISDDVVLLMAEIRLTSSYGDYPII